MAAALIPLAASVSRIHYSLGDHASGAVQLAAEVTDRLLLGAWLLSAAVLQMNDCLNSPLGGGKPDTPRWLDAADELKWHFEAVGGRIRCHNARRLAACTIPPLVALSICGKRRALTNRTPLSESIVFVLRS